MIRRGKTSAHVAPGKVSSTTAQGVLPNYAGHATASLVPTIANAANSPRGRPTKLADNGMRRTSPTGEKQRENRPPSDIRRDDSTNRGIIHR